MYLIIMIIHTLQKLHFEEVMTAMDLEGLNSGLDTAVKVASSSKEF